MDGDPQAIAQNRDIAELMTTGLRGERDLDAADQLRLEQMLQENGWAASHIWDRTQRDIFPKGTFEATAGALLGGLLRTPRGADWWRTANISASLLGSSRTSTPWSPRPNQSLKPTAPDQVSTSELAADPVRGLSLSR